MHLTLLRAGVKKMLGRQERRGMARGRHSSLAEKSVDVSCGMHMYIVYWYSLGGRAGAEWRATSVEQS